MITPRIKVNADKLGALIPRYIAETRKGVRASLLTVSRTTTRELIKYTPPYDKSDFTSGPKAKKAGEAAVVRDIGRVYWTVNQLFGALKDAGHLPAARSIRKLCTLGQFGQAEEVLRATGVRYRNVPISFFDGGKAHGASRTRSGRVFRHVPALIVVDALPLKTYVTECKKRVGFTRAGWISAGLAAAIGGMSGFPVWIKRWSGSAPGAGFIRDGGNGIMVRLKNAVSWASNALPDGRIADALQDARTKLEKQMEHIIKYRQTRMK